MQSRQDVADPLEVEDRFLRILSYGTKERERYRDCEIRKRSGGSRLISVPPKNLAIPQRKLSTVLGLVYVPKACAFGFVRGKSLVGNASQHCKKGHLLNWDPEDFFPSISIQRVIGSISSYGVGHEAAVVLAQICCMADGTLPQGAPTSPIISNMICRSLDNGFMQLAKTLRCRYTRYADDLTLSTSLHHVPSKIGYADDPTTPGSEITSIVERNGFKINRSKSHYFSPLRRQEVTGIVVNEFPNVKRAFIRSVLGGLYAWEKHGYEKANAVYREKYRQAGRGAELRSHLRGKLCFLKMVIGQDAPTYRKAARRFNILNPAHPISVRPLTEAEPYPLRGKPPDEPWRLWFTRYASCIYLLEITTEDESKCAATAFCIGPDTLATAGHNLVHAHVEVFMGDARIQPECSRVEEGPSAPDVGLIGVKEGVMNCPSLLTQGRLPEIGEEVCDIGYPSLPMRDATAVVHTGIVEALPVTYDRKPRFIQVSFQSGGGLSGAPLIDKRGFVVGVMIENIFSETQERVPPRPYGQAVPIEYLADFLLRNWNV